MHELKPFQPIEEKITVRGSIHVDGPLLVVKFEFSDPHAYVQDAPTSAAYTGAEMIRADGLWQTTCFEAFWGESGTTPYYELNLSPTSNNWNLYTFDDYRKPQPPEVSHAFELKSLRRTPTTLEAQLECRRPLKNPDARLCTVIRLKSGPVYFSTCHKQAKPDFHDRESFTLQPARPA